MTSFPKGERCKEGRRSTCHACHDGGAAKPKPPKAPKLFVRNLPKAKRYLVTSAQNATPVHEGFLAALKLAAEHLQAELVMIPLRYKNPTRLGEVESDDWWDASVVPYLFDGRVKLHKHLVLVGDVKTQPTASDPLTGFESMTGPESCIIGHPQVAFKTVAVPSSLYPKILTTTGAVTKENYSDTRAGKVAEFHHSLGATLVEIDGKKFHLRQIGATDEGSFIDLDKWYGPDRVLPAAPALALVMGDTHARFTDPTVDQATFGTDGMVAVLNPETLVFHDVIDGYSCNPHHKGKPFIGIAKMKAGYGSVQDELLHVVDFVNERAQGRTAVIVDSNHHDFLPRYIESADWKTDPKNAIFYLETALHMASQTVMGKGGTETPDPFGFWIEKMGLGKSIRLLRAGESFRIAGIELGLHGHKGVNGAKGSAVSFSKVGDKTTTGHTHSPFIRKGAHGVGTSTPLRLEYTQGGLSTWLNTHSVCYANGKRSLLSMFDGAWRLLDRADSTRGAKGSK
ncbi:MAG: hypothetical protein NVS3B25_09800 [Hymenobacter sp.]